MGLPYIQEKVIATLLFTPAMPLPTITLPATLPATVMPPCILEKVIATLHSTPLPTPTTLLLILAMPLPTTPTLALQERVIATREGYSHSPVYPDYYRRYYSRWF